jgi:hypothetical protein
MRRQEEIEGLQAGASGADDDDQARSTDRTTIRI